MDISRYLYGVLNLIYHEKNSIIDGCTAPLSLFGMNDENEKVVMKIPLELDLEEKLNRLLIPVPIESYCYVMMNTIILDR